MTEPCELCGGPVNPHDMQTWSQVTGWVGGPKKDSMRLREYTKKYAHDRCVSAVHSGQAPMQPDLFAKKPRPKKQAPAPIDTEVTELFDD